MDLGIVEIGVTTGVDVNGLLVQGGGNICAALDVPGAVFNVSGVMPRVQNDHMIVEGIWINDGEIFIQTFSDVRLDAPIQIAC